MEMQQPESQPTSPPAGTQILDPADQYQRRRRTALWMTVALLVLALVVLTVGLVSATRTDNVPVSGYYPGISLSCGAFLGIIGIHLVENRRPMLIAAIIFISIGVIVSFLCAIVDGIIASEYIVSSSCSLALLQHIRRRSLLCVHWCQQLLGRDPPLPSHVDLCGAQHHGLNPGHHNCCHPGRQHNTNFQQLPTPQMMADTGLSSTTGFSSTTCPSEENQHAPQPQPQEGTQETGGFTLTPNAPVFYGPSFGGFEKPPPYAC